MKSLKQKIQHSSRNRAVSLLLDRKIKNRQKFFFHKRKSIPSICNKIVFGLPQTYRREIFYQSEGVSKKGEYLVSNMIEFLDIKKNTVIVDLFTQLKDDDSVLKSRLESDIETFPLGCLA